MKFKNNKLFFDFYIRDYALLIEVQGKQHFNFISHFHGDYNNFMNQKSRDSLKEEYAEYSGKKLIKFNYNEKLSTEFIYDKLRKAIFSEGFIHD